MITCYFEKKKKKVFLRHVVVDILVVKNKRILLVKRAGPKWYLETGKWAMPGGFVEMGETFIKLFQVNDNPHRPHELQRQNVSLIYLIKPVKKVSQHDHETSEIKWFDLDQLPSVKNFAFDHLETTQQLITSLDK
ncbi:MAG: NUDIX domain-containing protein [Patescibacteria group bacterium]|nr:NUDIX domain-containing protein [Patescibacteria group bacterium]